MSTTNTELEAAKTELSQLFTQYATLKAEVALSAKIGDVNKAKLAEKGDVVAKINDIKRKFDLHDPLP